MSKLRGMIKAANTPYFYSPDKMILRNHLEEHAAAIADLIEAAKRVVDTFKGHEEFNQLRDAIAKVEDDK